MINVNLDWSYFEIIQLQTDLHDKRRQAIDSTD